MQIGSKLSFNGYSDQKIINGILMLDLAVYEHVDKMYRERVIRHVCLNSGTIQEGEEHYQDVIFEIYLNIESGKYNENVKRTFVQNFWLMAKFRWIDKLRKREKIITSELNEVAMLIDAEDDNEILAKDIQNTLVLLINKHLNKLSTEEQEYIRLYYYASKSLQFIADYFGTTYHYSRLKLHRIRLKIRKLVEDDPEFRSRPYLFTS